MSLGRAIVRNPTQVSNLGKVPSMAFLDTSAQVLHINIAYSGPALAGKLTNLRGIHGQAPSEARSAFATSDDPFSLAAFYYMPPGGTMGSTALCFHISAISGPRTFSLKGPALLLRHVDAVVFVADAQASRLEATLESWEDLCANLADQGRPTIPRVLQYNKYDLPGVIAPEELDGALNPQQLPRILAVAADGRGVMETFKTAVKETLVGLRAGRLVQQELPPGKAPTEPLRLWSLFRT